jgi:RNA polymerase sigma-70 factor, ECF subfamily
VPHRTQEDLAQEHLQILAAQRDPQAFSALYERYVDQIYAYAYTLTRDKDQAEDVTAATFARALEELPRFEWRGVPYSAWLYRVTSNMVARDKRRPGWIELSPHTAADEADTPEHITTLHARDEQIRNAVAALPTDQRQAILLRFGGELRNKEIASIMGRSEGAIKLLTFRAMTTLRRRLGAPLPAERDDDAQTHRRHA